MSFVNLGVNSLETYEVAFTGAEVTLPTAQSSIFSLLHFLVLWREQCRWSGFYKFEKTGTLSRITVKNIEGLEERESLGADLDSGSQFWILHRGVPYNGQNERTYSTGSYPAPARSSWNYANNVYEYNQVLQDCNIRKRYRLHRHLWSNYCSQHSLDVVFL